MAVGAVQTMTLGHLASTALMLLQALRSVTRPVFHCSSIQPRAMTIAVVGDGVQVSGPTANGCPKVNRLRQLMAAADGGRGVQAYIIPSEDPHMVSIGSTSTASTAAFLGISCSSRTPALLKPSIMQPLPDQDRRQYTRCFAPWATVVSLDCMQTLSCCTAERVRTFL